MNSDWITLSNKKTPFWRSSVDISIERFMKEYKSLIDELSTTSDVVFKPGKITKKMG